MMALLMVCMMCFVLGFVLALAATGIPKLTPDNKNVTTPYIVNSSFTLCNTWSNHTTICGEIKKP